jgi:putative transcriptional regulator
MIAWAGDIRDIKTIPAILALSRRDMNLLRAKRAVEAMVAERRAFVLVPKVESIETLTRELAEAGVRAIALPDAAVDVRAMRERLGMTQEQFAVRYGLDIDAVRNWERGRRTPDTAAASYLRAIDADPDAVQAALWGETGVQGR